MDRMTLKTLTKMLFKPAARYPADPRVVFILALSVFSGLAALGLDTGPESLSSVMPPWAVIVWGVMLSLGSFVTLVGMVRQSINGIIIEQVGSVAVAATTLFYSAVAFYLIGLGALQSVGIICAWGLACAFRWFQLQALINNAAARKDKLQRLADLDRELAEWAEREVNKRRMRARDDEDFGKWGTP